MFRNRISRYFPEQSTEEQIAPVAPNGFTAVPVQQLPAEVQQVVQRQKSIYELAYGQAQAAADADWFKS